MTSDIRDQAHHVQGGDRPGGAMTIAVLPVKRFDAAKSRLSVGLDNYARRRLARAMLQDTLVQIADCDEIDGLIVASSEPEVIDLVPGAVLCGRDADTSHSAAAAAAIELAVKQGAATVALLPGDCPLVRAAEIDSLVRHARDSGTSVCVVPDHTGTGTNALILTPPTAIAPAFGPDSRVRHLRLAHEAGVTGDTHDVRGLNLDIDNFEDCAELALRLGEPGHTALNTENVLAEILVDRHRLPGGLAR
jgi:2-phospho-L-lactate guanylyltransferase